MQYLFLYLFRFYHSIFNCYSITTRPYVCNEELKFFILFCSFHKQGVRFIIQFFYPINAVRLYFPRHCPGNRNRYIDLLLTTEQIKALAINKQSIICDRHTRNRKIDFCHQLSWNIDG